MESLKVKEVDLSYCSQAVGLAILDWADFPEPSGNELDFQTASFLCK